MNCETILSGLLNIFGTACGAFFGAWLAYWRQNFNEQAKRRARLLGEIGLVREQFELDADESKLLHLHQNTLDGLRKAMYDYLAGMPKKKRDELVVRWAVYRDTKQWLTHKPGNTFDKCVHGISHRPPVEVFRAELDRLENAVN